MSRLTRGRDRIPKNSFQILKPKLANMPYFQCNSLIRPITIRIEPITKKEIPTIGQSLNHMKSKGCCCVSYQSA